MKAGEPVEQSAQTNRALIQIRKAVAHLFVAQQVHQAQPDVSEEHERCPEQGGTDGKAHVPFSSPEQFDVVGEVEITFDRD